MLKLFLVGVCAIGMVSAATWSYDGAYGSEAPINWANTYSGCSPTNSRQSPVDIREEVFDSALVNFTFVGYDNMGGSLNTVNNGHTVRVDVADPTAVRMSGGNLTDDYRAAQLHFHWGADDTTGSEHFFRGFQYPLEVHIVHFKAGYGDLTTAVANGDGLAVLGFFFEISDTDNAAMDPIINALSSINAKDQTTNINFNFESIFPDAFTQEYYRYLGGLTTPGCDEVVIWTVFESKIKISSAQLAKFRLLRQFNATDAKNDLITFNYRPLQLLSGRTIYKSYSTDLPSNYHWEYAGPMGTSSWPVYYPTCNGKLQSPVDIPAITSPSIAQFDANVGLDTLTFVNYDTTITGTIKNNGHTIQVDIENTNTDMYIEHGNLSSQYVAAQFHFHWGTSDATGSEHTHNGNMYPLELHIVHYKREYESLGVAAGKHDGLAVVGFWFEAGATNANYANLISSLPNVRFKDLSQAITGFSLSSLTFSDLKSSSSAAATHNFYRYQGGLTTPPCSEVVTWTVVTSTIKISTAQLAAFRDMLHIVDPGVLNYNAQESDKIGYNYRPTQPLKLRTIHTSWNWQAVQAGAPKPAQSVILCTLLLFLAVFFR